MRVELKEIDMKQLNKMYIGEEGKATSVVLPPPSSQIPVATVFYMAVNTAPAGYLICDGRAVERSAYPELFDAIGATYGEGDGSTTFNLPDLMDKIAWGSTTVGQVKEAGLPNITGYFDYGAGLAGDSVSGCFYIDEQEPAIHGYTGEGNNRGDVFMDASRSNAIYGKSNTVQPPALTLLPVIKY
jgi:hypothetical protein